MSEVIDESLEFKRTTFPTIDTKVTMTDLRRQFINTYGTYSLTLFILSNDRTISFGYSNQHFITTEMRFILFDWLSEMAQENGSTRETLYLSYSLLDRFVECTPDIKTDRFQLIGITCFYIAEKLDIRKQKPIRTYSSVIDPKILSKDVVKTELEICFVKIQ